ncbi:acyl-CoA N-acyltransferase [Russula vinacea]|nr:acyl-CoA N-acyltransferase [Russula vinacea]
MAVVAGSIRSGRVDPRQSIQYVLRLLDIMSFTNSYKEDDTPLPSGYYGPDPYDINWMMPLYDDTLESDRIKLTPFIPSLYARGYADQVKAHPDLHRWFPFKLSTLDEILTQVETFMRRYPTGILFAIIDKPRGNAFAGVIGLLNSSPVNLTTEMAWVVVFPEFRRSYVTSNAIGLLLNYCLELPSSTTPGRPRGLGFRRVQWTAHSDNKPSLAAAKRMGFKEEGEVRWSWVLPEGAEGNGIPLRDGDPMSPRPGRHNIVFSFCADDWESGGREHVRRLMDRQ